MEGRFSAASALEQRPEGVGVEDTLEVLPVDHSPHYDSTPLDMPVPPLERGDLGILVVEVEEPVFADSQERQGAVQPMPFVQHEEPALPPSTGVRGRVSRSRRRFAHLLVSDEDTTCSESDSSDDDFHTSSVPEFPSDEEDKDEHNDECGESTYDDEEEESTYDEEEESTYEEEEEESTYEEEEEESTNEEEEDESMYEEEEDESTYEEEEEESTYEEEEEESTYEEEEEESTYEEEEEESDEEMEEEFDLEKAVNAITSPLARKCLLRRLGLKDYEADDEA